MRNFFMIVPLALLFIFGCEKESLRTSFHNRGVGPGRDLTSSDHSSGRENADTTVYVLGVEYPWTYDWQRDTAYGNVDFRFVVFANQKRIMEIDGGPSKNLSPDTDRNRLMGGHLYSDFATGGETILLRDGKEIFRYEGEEIMCGIMVTDGSLYTLGQGRRGKGFSFRKDGEIIISRSGGHVIGDMLTGNDQYGALYPDGEDLCFCFADSDEGKWAYYCVRNGKSKKIDTPSNISEMLDMRLINGNVHMVYKSSNSGERPVYCGPNGKAVQLGKDSFNWKSRAICFSRIYPYGDKVVIQDKHLISSDGSAETMLWNSDGSSVHSGLRIVRYWTDESNFSCLYAKDNGQVSCILFNGDNEYIYEPSRIAGLSCGLLKGGCFYVLLTPERSDLSPFLWKNGKQLALPINGYLVGLEVEF